MKKKYTTIKAFENESFVNCINKLYAQRLEFLDNWGETNLSNYIEFLAEQEIDCCGIPAVAFKMYVENEEDWENSYKNREANPALSAIYDLLEEKKDELYEDIAEGIGWEFLPDEIEEAASELSGMLSTDSKDHTEEWIEHLMDACKGVEFSLN